MDLPGLSFADVFSAPLQITGIVFNVLRAAVFLPFRVHNLEMHIETFPLNFLDVCFQFAKAGPEQAELGNLANLLEVLDSQFRNLSKNAFA